MYIRWKLDTKFLPLLKECFTTDKVFTHSSSFPGKWCPLKYKEICQVQNKMNLYFFLFAKYTRVGIEESILACLLWKVKKIFILKNIPLRPKLHNKPIPIANCATFDNYFYFFIYSYERIYSHILRYEDELIDLPSLNNVNLETINQSSIWWNSCL